MRGHQSAPNPSDLRVVSSYACELGENPLWHTDEQRLYWCDITAGTLLCFDPRTGATDVVREGDGDPNKMIGGFTIEEDGALLLFMAQGRIERWSNGDSELVTDGAPEILCTRFNDVIADPLGRVFCGTMSVGNAPGKLYLLDLDRTLTPVVENVGCSNGLAFTHDGSGLYYTDSHARTLTRFEYDRDTGTIARPRMFIRTGESDGAPDGMTVDAEGHIWSAHWNGGFIVRYAPSGEEELRIALPVPKVTSVTFGGDALATLFITTASGENGQADGALAGNLFALEPGVCGLPEFRSRICSTPFQE